jgi:hypothetical protein
MRANMLHMSRFLYTVVFSYYTNTQKYIKNNNAHSRPKKMNSRIEMAQRDDGERKIIVTGRLIG